MPKYVIERTMPGAGRLSAAELRAASEASNQALASLAPRVTWQQSYVTDDKIFCVYHAEDPEVIREHARRAGFPADAIHLVGAVIDPSTGDAAAQPEYGITAHGDAAFAK
ncbi:DUF4242 domain-containing protein [Mycolicibacterium hodleri]|uniref:DUF4242 domain-containing protein n=1 Tax=Mycolicibacterium hodleri TaxID=49897 RepID=A0A502EEN3_9MYCO|nr:DUF4242 domain-containing protein [Mycolicibacterium hodleri]TPG34956.1 DUF4242 domain-containing protein [Mycolicibacterium hodleri]